MAHALKIAFALLAVLLPGLAHAHEVRPGHLELREVDAETYAVFWKVPARGDLRLRLRLRFPDRCHTVVEPTGVQTLSAYSERYRVSCAGGLAGETIAVEGLDATLTDVFARVEFIDGTTQVARVTPDAPTLMVSPKQGGAVSTYFGLGVEHILFGVDHLLFVITLLLLIRGWRRLLITITAFSLAHSVTLAAAVLGFVRVPVAPIEALIALSIVIVAVEIVHAQRGRVGLAYRKPWLIAIAFGLLHGLGFASALSEVGLPDDALALALLLFNLGVEAGQVGFVAAVLVLAAAWHRLRAPRPAWARSLAAYVAGSLAFSWCLERVVAGALETGPVTL